jgi:hypothetical protein
MVMVAVDFFEALNDFLDGARLVSDAMLAVLTRQMIVRDLRECTVNSANNDDRLPGILVVGLRVVVAVAVDCPCLLDKFFRGRSSIEGPPIRSTLFALFSG